ncbi:MAG: LysM domain-containing protein [Proteobacteria bacterium]|nr:MAG: LysM domain-containing protein [Pseudomonadota bacterium]
MKLVNGLRALALTAFIFSSFSCTSDGTEDTEEAVEEDNQVPSQEGDEVSDASLPTAEAASVEAEQGVETIDSSSNADVQTLPSDQQIAVDEAAQAGIANGAGQEIASASTAGAEVDAAAAAVAEAPMESPSFAEAAPVAEAPMASPSLAAEDSGSVPTIADVVADSESAQADAPKPVKEKKAKKGKRARKMPTLSGNEKMYIVQPGDTLAAISAVLFGSRGEWKNLADLNGLSSKSLIFPGDAIKYVASEKTAAFEAKFEGLAKQSVTVAKGDTLSKIAARVMGSASYWKMIWRWNEAAVTDPNKIAVGMSLSYVGTAELEAASAAVAH